MHEYWAVIGANNGIVYTATRLTWTKDDLSSITTSNKISEKKRHLNFAAPWNIEAVFFLIPRKVSKRRDLCFIYCDSW